MMTYEMRHARANPPESKVWFKVAMTDGAITALEEHDGYSGGPIGTTEGVDLEALFLRRVEARALINQMVEAVEAARRWLSTQRRGAKAASKTDPAVRTLTVDGAGVTSTGARDKATVTMVETGGLSVAIMHVPEGQSTVFAYKDHGAVLDGADIGLRAFEPGLQAGIYGLDSYRNERTLTTFQALPGVTCRENADSRAPTGLATVMIDASAIAAFRTAATPA